MNTFRVDDLSECDLVPCACCGKLFDCCALDGDLRCDDCVCFEREPS